MGTSSSLLSRQETQRITVSGLFELGKLKMQQKCLMSGTANTLKPGWKIFQDTYHERPDHHIWHLGQLVVQQGSGCMICHLQGESKYLYSFCISDKAVSTCRKRMNSMERWQTREYRECSVSFPLTSGIN